MQFRDLQKQYEILKSDIDKAMIDVAGSSKFINGPWVQELEQQLAEFVGVKHCVSCANGTDALTMAMMAWGIGPGDAVFVPDFTFFSSGEVVSHAGATPVFVDVNKDTFNISPKSLTEAIEMVLSTDTLIPKAVVAVDLFGLPADMKEIKLIADKYNLLICEDGAQGFGGSIGGKRACSFGNISTTSFFPAKPLGCYGDGGAVFTDDDDTARLLKSIRVHGKGNSKYDNIRIGLNSRLDTLQAAILLPKLRAFEEYELEDVNKVAKWYDEALEGTVITPTVPEGFYSSWAQYTIRLKNEDERNGLQEKLKDMNIPSMVYYMKPMNEQGAFADGRCLAIPCPNTEELCKTVLSLPMHPYMTEEDVHTVCRAIKEYLY